MQDIIRYVSSLSYLPNTQVYRNRLTLRLNDTIMTIYEDPDNFLVLFPLGRQGSSVDARQYIKEEDGEQYLRYMNIRVPGYTESGVFTMNISDSGEVIAVINCFVRILVHFSTFQSVHDMEQNNLDNQSLLPGLLSTQDILNRPGPGGCVDIS